MNFDTVVAQRTQLILSALSEMGGARSKQEVLQFIQTHGWMDLRAEDWEHYPAHTEPKWHTDLAWARQKCVELEWMFAPDEKDYWALTRVGFEKLKDFEARFQGGEWNVRLCFLWSATFKKRMCSNYAPSHRDKQRHDDSWRDYA